MSSSEIIELNSSDEETEKKPKKKKPRLDAMVAIPNQNITGLKIHNISRPFTPLNNFPRMRAAQVATRVHLPVAFRPNFPQAFKARPAFSPRRITPNMQYPKIINTMSLNGHPITHISQKKTTKLNVNPVSIAKIANNCKKQTPNSPKQSKSIPDLPPGITVTRTTGQLKRKIAQRPTFPSNIVIKKTAVPEITLDDDDDLTEVSIDSNAEIVPIEFEVPALDSSSKLNDSYASNTKDEGNNIKAPETPSKSTNKQTVVTEILIEDSPVKPVVESAAKRLAREEIVIEDSPVKNDSEPENDEDRSDYNSRKKLDFSKKCDPSQDDKKETTEKVKVLKSQNNSPVEMNGKTKKDKFPKLELSKPVENKAEEESEFNEVYQKFIEACLKVEASNDMKRIVEKKVKAYYREVDKKLTDSTSFLELVNAKILALETEPTNSFLHIKDIVDQLSIWRNNPKIVLSAENLDSEKEVAKQRHLKKLERALQKLHRAIQKLEEKEVDFDDDADSVYLLTDRYKARLVRIHDKICELTGTRVPPALAPLVLQPPLGSARGPTAKLQAWLNKPGKCASVLPFPDFHDVLTCVREANREDQLGWTESQLEEEARTLFTHCGKILQKRRQEMEWRLAASRLPAESDPAECDQGLQAKLQDNEKIAIKREQDVFNTFADRQTQLKLEAEEISDHEVGKTDKSDGSDDDEVIFLDEASQDGEAGTSKDFPKPVLDKDVKEERSNEEDNAQESEIMETNEEGKEEKDEDSDSSLKTLSSDSDDLFKGKSGIPDSERIDLESDDESSIYSVVSGSSQEDGNSNSPSCENSGVPKNTSDTEEVIEFLDEESMESHDQDNREVIEDDENSVNSEGKAKVVDLDEESKDGDSTEIINHDRIVRIDSSSLDEQIFINLKSSDDTEKCPLEKIDENYEVETLYKSNNDSEIAGSPTDNTDSQELLEDVKLPDVSSKVVNEEVSQGNMTATEKTQSLNLIEETEDPISEITSNIDETEQNSEIADGPQIVETHSLRDEDRTEILIKESGMAAEIEPTDKRPKPVLESSSSNIQTEESEEDGIPQESSEEIHPSRISHEKLESESAILEIADIKQNVNRSFPSENQISEIEENIQLVWDTDELLNSDTESELSNVEKTTESTPAINPDMRKGTAISQNERIEENKDAGEKMDTSETETFTEINDNVPKSTTKTDVVMKSA